MDNALEKHVKTITSPIFEKVLQETTKNRMSVGSAGQKCFYQPHNCRLYFDFNRENFKAKSRVTDPSVCIEHKIINKTEHFYRFKEFNFRVKTAQIMVLNNKNYKKWYPINVTTDSEKQILKIMMKKYRETRKALQSFLRTYGGTSKYKVLNVTSEDKVLGEEAIKLLPLKMRFHNKVVKKLYNEQSIEFSSPALAATYFSDRAVENIAPQIARRLKKVENFLEEKDALLALKSKIHSVADIIKNKKLILLLNDREKAEFEVWLIINPDISL